MLVLIECFTLFIYEMNRYVVLCVGRSDPLGLRV